MKIKTTAKAIKESGAEILYIPYCGADSLLSIADPIAYTMGIYGWNFDAYAFYVPGRGDVIIETGYRGYTGRKANNYKEYEERARKLKDTIEFDGSFDAYHKARKELLEDFLMQA